VWGHTAYIMSAPLQPVGRVSTHDVPAMPDDIDDAPFIQHAGLVNRPEEWPFGGEIFYDDAGGPTLVRGTPPLLKTGMLVEDKRETTPCGDTRPTS